MTSVEMSPDSTAFPKNTKEIQERLAELCGGTCFDQVVLLGGGSTQKNIQTAPPSRERTIAYTRPNTPLAAGVRARTLAAITLHENLTIKKFLTLGGRKTPDDPKNPYNPFAGTSPSAQIAAQELEKLGGIARDQIEFNIAPTTTALEVMEIVLILAKKITTGQEIKNCLVITNDYQIPRVQAFLEKMSTDAGRAWLLHGHLNSLEKAHSRFVSQFQQLAKEITNSWKTIIAHGVEINPVGAEQILRFRSKRWRQIVDDQLPVWQPWVERTAANKAGAKDIASENYRFNSQQIDSYLQMRLQSSASGT